MSATAIFPRPDAGWSIGRVLALVLALLAVLLPCLNLVPGVTPALGTQVAFTAVQLIGLNLIFGLTGMLAFGQAAFVALPGYLAGVFGQLGVPLPVALLAGLLGTVAIARLLAMVFVRLPGIFLAVGTLGFAFVVEGLARAFPAWTGGASGLVLQSGRALSATTWYAVAVAVLLVALLAQERLARGALLRTLRMIRHDELAAETMGIDVTAVKIRIFTLGSVFSAVGGLFMAYYVGVLVPESAGVNRSLEQIGMLLLGGSGALLGPVFGSFVVNWLLSIAGHGARYELLIYGLAFLGAVLYARDGIAGLLASWLPVRRAALAPPAPVPTQARREAAPLQAAAGPCLELRNIAKHFGGLRALSDVSFSVFPGEIFALVGPNGAGKSTLFNIVSGIERPTSGVLELSGRNIVAVPIHRRAPALGRSFQVARLVPQMTAAENVMVRLDQIAPGLTETEREMRARAQLQGFGLGELADRPVRELSIGQHKLIDLARAAVGEPEVVLLDEPAVGLTGEELEHLRRLLLTLKARGCAVVIVEHNIGFVAQVAERGVVLDHGVIIASGPVDQILADPAVQKAYFGVLP